MRISIITATLNSSLTIGNAISSLNSQKYKDVEHIISDGGSVDNTIDIVKNQDYNNTKFRIGKDSGVYDAINKGIALSTGDIIGLLHSDDEYAYKNVLTDVAKIFANSEVDFIYGDLNYVKRENTSQIVRYWKSGAFDHDRLLRGWIPPHPTLFVRRSVIEKYGLYDPEFKISGDYEYMLRLFKYKNLNFCYLPRVMINMRVGGVSNKNIKNRLKANLEDRLAWKKNSISPKWYTFVLKPLRKIPQFFVSPPLTQSSRNEKMLLKPVYSQAF